MSGYGGFGRGGQRRWQKLGDYEASEHIAKLAASGLSLSAYARQAGVHRNALAEALKETNPDLYAKLVAEQPDAAKKGTKFEYAVKGMLQRRGYYAVRQYASKSPFDLLAVGAGKPVLFVQAKKDGKLFFNEWNALFDLATKFGGWPVLVARGPDGKGALWFRLDARKEQKGQRADGLMTPFDPREPEQVSLLAPAAA